MTTRWKVFVFILLVLCLFVGILIFKYIENENQRRLLSAQISQIIYEYEDGQTPYINFLSIPDLSWGKLYIFGPYTSCKSISQSLETLSFFYECKLSGIETIEYKSLFVFIRDGKVVQYLIYERVLADSTYAFKEDGYLFGESYFVLDEHGQLVWVGSK